MALPDHFAGLHIVNSEESRYVFPHACHLELAMAIDANLHRHGDTLEILVGEGRRCFIVHQHLICAKSKYFADKCSRQEWSGRNKTITLRETEGVVFEAYWNWVYFGVVRYDFDDHISVSEASTRRVKLYVLARKFQDTRLANSVMTEFIDTYDADVVVGGLPGPGTVTWLYDHLEGHSPMKVVIVDIYIGRILPNILANCIGEFPRQFVDSYAIKAGQNMWRAVIARPSNQRQLYRLAEE